MHPLCRCDPLASLKRTTCDAQKCNTSGATVVVASIMQRPTTNSAIVGSRRVCRFAHAPKRRAEGSLQDWAPYVYLSSLTIYLLARCAHARMHAGMCIRRRVRLRPCVSTRRRACVRASARACVCVRAQLCLPVCEHATSARATNPCHICTGSAATSAPGLRSPLHVAPGAISARCLLLSRRLYALSLGRS